MRQDVILSTRMKKELPDSSSPPPPDFLDGRKRAYDGVMWELKGILGMDNHHDDELDEEEEEDTTSLISRCLPLQVINEEESPNREEYWPDDLIINYDDDHQGIIKKAPPSSSSNSSLKLSLNYQKVLDAWSDRGPFWADINTPSPAYMGEVPELLEMVEGDDEKRCNRIRRREASVLRYKEKRQSRFFSKKIRYQVRKLNADQRPRLKGRFVKRSPEKIFI